MTIVAREGLVAARHLRGPLYEVRVPGKYQDYRVLFAPQGKYSNIFLALEAFPKRTQQSVMWAILDPEGGNNGGTRLP